MDRLSEDLGAFCKIMDYCPVYFEVDAPPLLFFGLCTILQKYSPL